MIIDSSTLISMARAGLLPLLPLLPHEVVILDVVWNEVVVSGRAGNHPDAVPIAQALADSVLKVTPAARTVDAAVLAAAAADGTLACNDAVLGRRARSLGARWLRSADLLVLLLRLERITPATAASGIQSLFFANRITAQLRDQYMEVLNE
ncbi:MAG: hypothetical protein ACT4OS_04045 [Acidimicrobiales bacterium]